MALSMMFPNCQLRNAMTTTLSPIKFFVSYGSNVVRFKDCKVCDKISYRACILIANDFLS